MTFLQWFLISPRLYTGCGYLAFVNRSGISVHRMFAWLWKLISDKNSIRVPHKQQCWDIANWPLRNKPRWNFNRNSYIFIHENAFEKVVCEMADILSPPHCFKYARGFIYVLCFGIFIGNLLPHQQWGGWGCEVSCGGHHRPKGKTTTGSALDGAVFDTAQILAYLVHNMSRSQLYLGFGHFGWLPSFFGQ